MLRNEESVFTKLQRIEELAKKDMNIKFTSLAHLLKPELLEFALGTLNKHGAPGVDGVTIPMFKENLGKGITVLHQELKDETYQASNVRRTYIPKSNGKLRPLGIPTVPDRIAQKAVAIIME